VNSGLASALKVRTLFVYLKEYDTLCVDPIFSLSVQSHYGILFAVAVYTDTSLCCIQLLFHTADHHNKQVPRR
jgi:hypothetical protein